MTTEKILTNEEIIAIGNQACAIESGENGYILPIAFARAIEQAILKSLYTQTNSTIRGDSYDGINDVLIAAAPDLLEALDELAIGYAWNDWDAGLVKRLEKARAALAKALGEKND